MAGRGLPAAPILRRVIYCTAWAYFTTSILPFIPGCRPQM